MACRNVQHLSVLSFSCRCCWKGSRGPLSQHLQGVVHGHLQGESGGITPGHQGRHNGHRLTFPFVGLGCP